MKYVTETKAAKSLSAYVILKRGKEVARVTAHFSDGGNVLVNVHNIGDAAQVACVKASKTDLKGKQAYQVFGCQMVHQRQKELGRRSEVEKIIPAHVLCAIYLIENRVQSLPSGRGLKIRRYVAQPGDQPTYGFEIALAAAGIPKITLQRLTKLLLADVRKREPDKRKVLGEKSLRCQVV